MAQRVGNAGRPGVEAERPSEIPPAGWKQVLVRAWREGKADNVSMLAGGVAFFGFLALFPALIAAISIWGLLVSPEQAARQVEDLTAGLPSEARQILSDQVESVAGGDDRGLGIGLAVAILLALWSASGGMSNLMKAVNIAYDEDEERGFVKTRALALALTVGAIIFTLLTVALVAAVPPLLDALGLGPAARIGAQVARWLLLVLLVIAALAVIYRVAPDRDAPRFRWVSLGAVAATVLWVIGSVAFSLYVSNFGSYQKTYGAIAGVAVLMLWLYLTAYIVLLGAEVNAESEKQTRRDTTKGETGADGPPGRGRRRHPPEHVD